MRNGLMTNVRKGIQLWPALLFAVLAIFCCCDVASAQYVPDLPPPPPLPTPKPTPKPTPTPEPKDEDFDVIKVSSNLVMVPVSVVDAKGAPVHGLPVGDFRLEEEGRLQEIVEIGKPDQVPLDIAV